MKLRLFTMAVSVLILLNSCHNGSKKQEQGASKSSGKEVKYAKGFTIDRFDDYTRIQVRNPWDSTKYLATYLLVEKSKELPANLPQGTVVRTPVDKVAICSAVHAGMWNMLGKINALVGVCEPQYMNLSAIKVGLKNGKISDLGLATAINMEKLLAAKPEALVISPFESSVTDRFTNAGIVVIQDASYMEDSPLGRSEWIKFEAAFAGKQPQADTIFAGIEKRYLDLCQQVSTTKDRPTVFTEKKYADAWYVSGGNSYVGRFLKDAGANYLWNDLKNSGSVPISFEQVFAKAHQAQFWLIKYNQPQDMTYNQLLSEYALYANFEAFKQKKIWGMNSGKTPYYEEGPMEPDVVLSDLIAIFHPELMKDYKAKYYFKMEN